MKQICANCKHNKRTYDGHCNAEFCCDNESSHRQLEILEIIDNLVKEMVGESNDT